MAGSTLATQFVEFAAKGIEKVQSQMDGLREKLGSIDELALTLQGSLGALAGVALFQGTAEGERFAELMSQLTREIAAVFLPVIEMVMDVVNQMIAGFRSLGGEGQNAIAALLAFTGPLGMFISGVIASEAFRDSLVKVANVLGRLASAVGELALPVIEAAFNAIAMVLENVIIPALELMVELFERARKVAEMLGLVEAKNAEKDKQKRRQVGAPGGQFEDVQQTFKRIQEAALKTGTGSMDPQERAAKAAEEMNAKMGESLVVTIIKAIKDGAIYLAKAMNPFG